MVQSLKQFRVWGVRFRVVVLLGTGHAGLGVWHDGRA